ncbi:MAG: hypothetical protein ABIN89_29680 [Chitinophagaceae bacterium]
MKNILFINGAGVVLVLSMFLVRKQMVDSRERTGPFYDYSPDYSKTGFARITCLADALKSTLKEEQVASALAGSYKELRVHQTL